MAGPDHDQLPAGLVITEEEIDAVLEEFGGDSRAAIRALLADIATLAHDHVTTVSLGFVRGNVLGSTMRRRNKL